MDRLVKLGEKKSRLVLGLMSGTSLDGVDLALSKLEGQGPGLKIKPLAFRTYPMPDHWRKRIQAAFKADTEELCRVHYDLGRYFADLVTALLKEIDLPLDKLDLIGSHGQTLFHVPGHSSLQIGEADIIAQRTRTPVIFDFRAADIAAGGQGAPLVSYLDQILFQNESENIVLLNIGGLSNLTFLPKESQDPTLAFDTGPGNAILNELAEIITDGELSYDRDGLIAQKGKLNHGLLEELLKEDYFAMPPPKSTGRELFGKRYTQEQLKNHPEIPKEDLMRSLVSLVSQSISQSIKRFLPETGRMLISGGGSHHPLLILEIKEQLPEIKVEIFEEIGGITADSKEAVAFSVLAHERINGTPTNLPSATGAKRKVVLGKIALP
ncbi:MAG: anhydro-N-acetylmuramic acid kinase [Deltaproteobacteria bacterium]|nr:anhydro-N-acetylmuramic acid kinase [Deltaproteobacteria bacterium]